jgi:hypothetical protein
MRENKIGKRNTEKNRERERERERERINPLCSAVHDSLANTSCEGKRASTSGLRERAASFS